jgi:hypothetical protein
MDWSIRIWKNGLFWEIGIFQDRCRERHSGNDYISSIQASFGKRSGSGAEQVVKYCELQVTFFANLDYYGFLAKMA